MLDTCSGHAPGQSWTITGDPTMTNPRDEHSFEAAVLEVIRTLRIKGATEAAQISPKTLRDYSDPTRAGNISLVKAARLDRACCLASSTAPLLRAYLHAFGLPSATAKALSNYVIVALNCEPMPNSCDHTAGGKDFAGRPICIKCRAPMQPQA
jgi:hypothetical protein